MQYYILSYSISWVHMMGFFLFFRGLGTGHDLRLGFIFCLIFLCIQLCLMQHLKLKKKHVVLFLTPTYKLVGLGALLPCIENANPNPQQNDYYLTCLPHSSLIPLLIRQRITRKPNLLLTS